MDIKGFSKLNHLIMKKYTIDIDRANWLKIPIHRPFNAQQFKLSIELY